jgi:branched-chain amino acid transport system substrate-binding protein
MGTTRRALLVLLATAGLLGLAACSESAPDESAGGPDDSAGTTESTLRGPTCGSNITVGACLEGQETSIGVVPESPEDVPEGEPIVVGMINQENTAGGSFPEVRLAVEAGVDFINSELGGIDGRPIELRTCITEFSVESSQACAQQMVSDGAVAVLGGIDVLSDGSIPVLEDNGIPYVGGIPVGAAEVQSDTSFIFSGGSAGAMAAFADDAIQNGAETVSVAYADFASISGAAQDYAVAPLEAAGVEVREVEFGVVTTDFLPVITQAAEGNPDAIIVAAADSACAPIMRTVQDLGVDSQLYLVGACVAPEIIEEVGEDAATGTIFNVEGLLDLDDEPVFQADTDLYIQVIENYATDLDWAGAGTVSFRGLMNLYNVMAELGADDISPESITAAFQAAVDEPSFNGHPYTCDGEQIPGLPGLCSPQQVLGQREDGSLVQVSDGWVDVPALVAEQAS